MYQLSKKKIQYQHIHILIMCGKSCILKRNVFVFFCAELIEELGGTRNVKFGTQVSNNESTINFEDQSEIFTPRRDR